MDERDDKKEGGKLNVSRRGFIKSVGSGILISSTISPAGLLKPASAAERDQVIGPDRVQLELSINGKKHALEVETRTTLAEALRDKLDMTGTKVVCDRGSCGGCTVLMDGDPICSCMMLACDATGHNISTIEGLAKGDILHPLQECFIEFDALQCGFCTPGMILSCKALLDHNSSPTLEEARAAVSGNLCRCGTYPHVFDATLAAAQRIKKG
jgi:xanthine dehydrogenase YagT iron-sulfur-binding subunit